MQNIDASQLTDATDRVVALQVRALEHMHRHSGGFSNHELALLASRSWRNSTPTCQHMLRRGMMAGDILRGLTPIIDEHELVVGKYAYPPLTDEEKPELEIWNNAAQPPGQKAHMAIDYSRVLTDGVQGVRAIITRFRTRLDLSRPEELEHDFFYRGCAAALDGMVALAGKYADLAEQQAARAADPQRQAELHEIARICRKVPEFPAETFAEAVQAMHFATFCMCAGNQMLLFQLGRPDQYLWYFYQRDIAAGRITPESAQELIDCVAILLNEYTPRGLAVGWLVCGRDEYGRDCTNELSYMFTQAVGHVRMAYPACGICWHVDMPPAILQLAGRLLARGYSHPAIFNDEVITRGLLRLGLSHRDACQYIHSACVEITPIALSNVYVASPYINLVQCLHDLLGIPAADGSGGGDLPEINTFEELLGGFRHILEEKIAAGVRGENRNMMIRSSDGGFPLLSCFVHDCLLRGRDIDQGGARVNWIEPSFVGLANLLDSLAAIRQFVYTEREFTLAHLRDALLANYIGYDEVKIAVGRAPKYGNDDDRVDALAQVIIDMIIHSCEGQRSYWGDAIVPGLFCWIMHYVLGLETSASADGRTSKFPLADGSGPAQGRERHGPTASVLSATKWDHTPMIGGIAVNMRFAPMPNIDSLVPPMCQVLETFMRLGGFEAQVNVVSAETLRAAQAHPEHHCDLVVRIAGYSDYFVSLTPELQAEVISRSELDL